MFIANRIEASGQVPGFRSVATAIGTPAARSSSTGGFRVSREEVSRPRQQHGNRARGGDGPHAVGVEIFEVIDREGLQFAPRVVRRRGSRVARRGP